MMLVVPLGVRTLILISVLLLVSTNADPSKQEIMDNIRVLRDQVSYLSYRILYFEDVLATDLEGLIKTKMLDLLDVKLEKFLKDPLNEVQNLNSAIEKIQITNEKFKEIHDTSVQGLQQGHAKIYEAVENFQRSHNISVEEFLEVVDEFKASHNTTVREVQTIVKNVGLCPEGFFRSPGTHQCFKTILDQKYNWTEADNRCMSERLQLAKPQNAVDLAKYLLERHGENSFWLGAQYSKEGMTWQNQDELVWADSPLWQTNPNLYKFTRTSCLQLITNDDNNDVLNHYPGKPYNHNQCSDHNYVLCELIFESSLEVDLLESF